MYKSGQILRTAADFDNAILFGLKIEVWQNGKLIDYGGVIESHSEYAVRFHNESKYLKEICEFRVR